MSKPITFQKGIITLALAIVIVIVGMLLGALVVGNIPFFKDSGVVACEKMADRANSPGKNDGAITKMTHDQYMETRKPFEDSGFTDIRNAGTALVDLVYDLQKRNTDDENLGGALDTLTQIHAKWGSLQAACGNHGVTLPPLTK